MKCLAGFLLMLDFWAVKLMANPVYMGHVTALNLAAWDTHGYKEFDVILCDNVLLHLNIYIH